MLYQELGHRLGRRRWSPRQRPESCAALKGFSAKTEENMLAGRQAHELIRRPRAGERGARGRGGSPRALADDRRACAGWPTRGRCDGWPRRSATSTSWWPRRTPNRSWRRSPGYDVVDRVIARGDTKTSILTRNGLQVDLRVMPLEAWGAAMIYFTGSKAHNIRIREMAVRKGLKLNEYGLFEADDRRPARRRDRGGGLRAARPAVHRAHAARGPRRDRGRAGRRAAGPDHLQQIRGDLHTHTNLTDGLATLEQWSRPPPNTGTPTTPSPTTRPTSRCSG